MRPESINPNWRTDSTLWFHVDQHASKEPNFLLYQGFLDISGS